MVTFTVSMATNTEVTSVDQSDENATTALYRAAIGPIGSNYYLPIFSRFEDAGKAALSWNWAAGLLTLNWMVFRQLWGVALAYAGALMIAILAVFGLGRLLFQLPQEAEIALVVVFGLLSLVLPGFYGNALLHAHCRKKMANALRTTATLPEACAVLTNAASSRQHLIGILIVNLALAGAIGGGVLAFQGVLGPATKSPDVADVRGTEVLPVTNLIPEPMRAASTPAAPMPEVASSDVAPVAMQPASEVSAPAIIEPLPAVAAELTASDVAVADLYQINVGLFANDANAQRVHAKLQAAKLSVYTEVLDTTNGKRTRVRVGPFKTEAEANAAARKIKALKFDAVVFKQ